MKKISVILFILIGCGDGREETTVLQKDEPICWTVDGEVGVNEYLPIGHQPPEEFFKSCQDLEHASFDHLNK